MSSLRGSPAAIARHMLAGPMRVLVRVQDPVNPLEIAADIHTALATHHTATCWLHARDDLGPVLQFAADHGERPLLVTTDTDDWSSLESDRAWSERGGSIAFVLSDTRVPFVPPQVSRLLHRGFVVRRSPLIPFGEEAQSLTKQVRRSLIDFLGADVGRLRVVASDLGLRWERIPVGGVGEAVFQEVVLESLRLDRLDELVRGLYSDYPVDELRVLYTVVRHACRCVDDTTG